MVDFSHPFSFNNSSRPEYPITVDSTSGEEIFLNFSLKHANSGLSCLSSLSFKCIMLRIFWRMFLKQN